MNVQGEYSLRHTHSLPVTLTHTYCDTHCETLTATHSLTQSDILDELDSDYGDDEEDDDYYNYDNDNDDDTQQHTAYTAPTDSNTSINQIKS